MSAHQVTPRHLATLIGIAHALHRAGKHGSTDYTRPENAEDLYTTFAKANADSVAIYYQEECEPEPVPEGGLEVPVVLLRTLDEIAAAIKAIDGFAYQCDCVDAWEETEVGCWCRDARRALIDMIPGFAAAYRAAPWSL